MSLEEINQEPVRGLTHLLDSLYDFDDSGLASKRKRKSRKKKSLDQEQGREELPAVGDTSTPPPVDMEVQLAEPRLQQTATLHQVEVVTFQEPCKRRRGQKTPVPSPQVAERGQSLQQEELSLEKARLEVHRLGISGFRKEKQRLFEQDRAIMLGARPPKKEYLNYRVLQSQLKEKKQAAEEELQGELKKKKKKRKNQPKDRRKASSSSGPMAQVGRFKDGVLILSSKEIQTLKGKIRAK